jgi:peptidoglycan/LPS O-acetylase OafA/YrhL
MQRDLSGSGCSAIGMMLTGGYGHADHFWTLAVEEQFYLLWPVVVLFSRRASFSP